MTGQAGNPISEKEAKRNKQAEYARQLQNDHGSASQQQLQYQQQHRQMPNDNDSAGGGGLGNIGTNIIVVLASGLTLALHTTP